MIGHPTPLSASALPPQSSEAPIQTPHAEFSAEGRCIVIGGFGSATIWDLPYVRQKLIDPIRDRLPRSSTVEEVGQYGLSLLRAVPVAQE